MIRIAIVENDLSDASSLREEIERYYALNSFLDYKIEMFANPFAFLDGEGNEYDLIFLDILMPNMNGMDLAFSIRERNSKSILVFVTNLLGYAIKGYQVDALDYIVKPVNGEHLAKTMDKAMNEIKSRESRFIALKNKTSVKVASVKDILYFEADSHLISYYFADGESFSLWSTLKKEAERFDDGIFIKINASQCVNSAHISYFDSNKLIVGGKTLFFSRLYKKEAHKEIMDHFGELV